MCSSPCCWPTCSVDSGPDHDSTRCSRSAAFLSDSGRSVGGGCWVEVAPTPVAGTQGVIQLVAQRNAGGDVQLDDHIFGHLVKMHDQRAQRVAMGNNVGEAFAVRVIDLSSPPRRPSSRPHSGYGFPGYQQPPRRDDHRYSPIVGGGAHHNRGKVRQRSLFEMTNGNGDTQGCPAACRPADWRVPRPCSH